MANWLSRTLKEEKERKRDKAFSLWLACHTQEEIAAAVEVASIQTISNWCEDFSKKLTDDNLEKWTDFSPPLYNVWKQQTKSDGEKVTVADVKDWKALEAETEKRRS